MAKLPGGEMTGYPFENPYLVMCRTEMSLTETSLFDFCGQRLNFRLQFTVSRQNDA